MLEPSKKTGISGETKKMRVAAYCRVSTQEDAQANSFEMQKQHFKDVIEGNPMYEMVDIYADDGISGTSINKRKEFLRMLDDARRGKIDLILTKSISRFARNIVDTLTTLKELADLNPPVTVVFETEGINTNEGRNSLVITILAAVAEMESQQKSEAVKAGIRYRMKEGLFKYSVRNTLGYYRDYSGKVRVEPHEAEIVKYIYESFLEGVSPQNIAEALTQQGISSPKGMNHWPTSTIRNILSNEKYCGDVLYQKTYTRDFKSHVSVKNVDALTQWKWENDHTAIIDRQCWQKAQELLVAHRWNRSKLVTAMKKKFTVAKVKSGLLCG